MTASSPAPALVVSDVEKAYGATRALKGVSFEFFPGRVHGLVGHNGAGKSTLVKILAGATPPDAGTVTLGGEPVAFAGPHQALAAGIATLYQDRLLVPLLSVLENVQLGHLPTVAPGIVSRRPRTAALEALDTVGLAGKANIQVGRLPVAAQQLVMVARALSWRARVIILDEPTVGFSAEEVNRLLEVVDTLRDRGAAIIFVTHRLKELARSADLTSVLRDGRKVLTLDRAEFDEDVLVEAMVGRRPGSRSGAQVPVAFGEAALLAVEDADDAADRFRSVSFAAHRREIIAFVGGADSGAQELCEALAGARPMRARTVTLNGRRLPPSTWRTPADTLAQGIVYLPRERLRRAVIGPLPLAQNVSIAALDKVGPRGVIKLRRERSFARRLLDDMSVRRAHDDVPLTSLSGGNQQKALFGRLFAAAPTVAVCEDPTAGVDTEGKDTIHALLRALAERGAVILSSDDYAEVAALASRVLVMRDGRIDDELAAPDLTEELITQAVLNSSGGVNGSVLSNAVPTGGEHRR